MIVVFPPLYAILDAALLRAPELEAAAILTDSGVGIIQYRNKRISARHLLELSRQLVSLLRPRSVRFIVNDRPDIAALTGAGGAHLGQEDLPIEAARAMCPSPFWLGVSTHTDDQVRAADATSADYIVFGPVFPTATKQDPHPVAGLDGLRRARALTGKPLVAIGGITLERAAEVYAAGADCLAVARDLLCAPDPAGRAREFLAVARACGRATGTAP